jgi:hypothetical protein
MRGGLTAVCWQTYQVKVVLTDSIAGSRLTVVHVGSEDGLFDCTLLIYESDSQAVTTVASE